jgi:hypothetical protein
MMKQFLPVITMDPASGSIPNNFVEMVCALLDFAYLAHLARLTEAELNEMEVALDSFHWLKGVVIELELMEDMSKFDWIPKLHMLGHYGHSVCEFRTPKGYNSETPDRLHIEYTKKGWNVSNHQDSIPQIIRFVQCCYTSFLGCSLKLKDDLNTNISYWKDIQQYTQTS